MPDDSNNLNTGVGAMAPDASTSPVGHTPGPWMVGGQHRRASVYAGQLQIAFAREDYSHINSIVAEANARLIAAAPELLEALEPFARMEVLEPNGVIVGLERYHFERARAAIAKARGTSPAPEVSHVG